jgi:hypothetical protein
MMLVAFALCLTASVANAHTYLVAYVEDPVDAWNLRCKCLPCNHWVADNRQAQTTREAQGGRGFPMGLSPLDAAGRENAIVLRKGEPGMMVPNFSACRNGALYGPTITGYEPGTPGHELKDILALIPQVPFVPKTPAPPVNPTPPVQPDACLPYVPQKTRTQTNTDWQPLKTTPLPEATEPVSYGVHRTIVQPPEVRVRYVQPPPIENRTTYVRPPPVTRTVYLAPSVRETVDYVDESGCPCPPGCPTPAYSYAPRAYVPVAPPYAAPVYRAPAIYAAPLYFAGQAQWSWPGDLRRHMVEHGYSAAFVGSLSNAQLIALHNQDHNENRVSRMGHQNWPANVGRAYAAVGAGPVTGYVTTPAAASRTSGFNLLGMPVYQGYSAGSARPAMTYGVRGGCPGGRCPVP